MYAIKKNYNYIKKITDTTSNPLVIMLRHVYLYWYWSKPDTNTVCRYMVLVEHKLKLIKLF